MRHVEDTSTNVTGASQYAFSIHDRDSEEKGKVMANVGGVNLSFIIDSGSSCNVIDRKTWEQLKIKDIKCQSSTLSKLLYAHGSKEPLKTAGTFQTTIQVGDQISEAEFIVIEGSGQALLGRDSSIKLGILTLCQVNHINTDQILGQFPELTNGFGKLEDFQLKIPIDDIVKPVIQPMRRVPYQLREKLDDKLIELEKLQIIEKVEGPSPWVSPIVCIPKEEKDIRLCVDMRRANEAVLREIHPIPTIEEIMQDFNSSTIFSKLDIKWAYHQIELSTESPKYNCV